ncbi:MAG: nucleotidyltransferase domain-containing protein [Deltaproteobacteria bacterium]|jgi:predicted nucleotidyltransferase|nr:nucleotidyltransferase domain-containing protein [Deltaproteobacteria bacterium]
MDVDFEAVRLEARRYAEKIRQEIPVIERVFLFGSYAKGTADKLSDVDIAVFIGDSMSRRRHEVGFRLMGLTHDFDISIEPLVFPSSEIARGNNFVREILRTGIEI